MEIKKKVGNEIKICLAVKADAYGHGAVAVSKMLEKEGLADYLAVATVDEGIELRDAEIKLPILILGLIMLDEAEKAVKNELTITVCEKELIDSINKVANTLDKIAKVHLKIDTGLGRIGCKPEETIKLVKYINEKKNLFLEGIFSHFSKSEINDISYTNNQLRLFNNVVDELKKINVNVPIMHMANSGAIVYFPESYFDMVRTGALIYGFEIFDDETKALKLNPTLSLRSTIIFIKKVKKNAHLSYEGTFITKKDTYIATIPAGYADGVPRALSNNHVVKVKEKFYPIVGNICMDQFLIDLGDNFYPIGTEVEIFGKNSVSISEVARKLNTIPHVITCRLKRAKKHYIS